MKHTVWLHIVLLLCSGINLLARNDCNLNCSGKPFVSRSVSFDTAREFVGWHVDIEQYDRYDEYYGSVNATYQFARSFANDALTDYFFGCFLDNTAGSCSKVLRVQGSACVSRDANAWLADYFGLPRQFKSSLIFLPQIEHHAIDINSFIGLDQWADGLYLRIHAPLVHTRWRLDVHETIESNKELTPYPAGYMGKERIAVTSLNSSMKEFWQGGRTFGDYLQPLRYSRVVDDTISKTRCAEINGCVGYTLINEYEYRFGLLVRMAAPLGNSPEGELLFEPIVGNAGHWTLGAGLTSQWCFWQSSDEERSWYLSCDSNAEHLFANQYRVSFDLCDKPMSRYLLVAQNGSVGNGTASLTFNNGEIAAVTQYSGVLCPLANKSTLLADVHYSLQADCMVALSYARGPLLIDIGYKLWGRTGAQCTISDCEQDIFNAYRLTIKGDAQLYGFGTGFAMMSGEGLPVDFPVALNPSQSKATVTHAQRSELVVSNFVPAAKALENLNADNRAVVQGRNDMDNQAQLVTITTADAAAPSEVGLEPTEMDGSRVRTNANGSLPARLLTVADLDTADGPAALSHTLFIHGMYHGREYGVYRPYIGVGGMVEFAQCHKNVRATASIWGVWVKAGIFFN